MEYKEVAEAKELPGLKLVLTKGVPGPWSESAKSIFHVKGIKYLPVAQYGNQANEALVDWTGIRNAPIAIYNDEKPRSGWLEILLLAERLSPHSPLLPDNVFDRALTIGLCHELCGENGLAWIARVVMMDAMNKIMGDEFLKSPMPKEYGHSPDAVKAAPANAHRVLQTLATQLEKQQAAGSEYFIGEQLTALDVYWANFSQMFDPLPPEVNPMPDYLKQMWGAFPPTLPEPVAPILMEHRNRIFERHLVLPLDF